MHSENVAKNRQKVLQFAMLPKAATINRHKNKTLKIAYFDQLELKNRARVFLELKQLDVTYSE